MKDYDKIDEELDDELRAMYSEEGADEKEEMPEQGESETETHEVEEQEESAEVVSEDQEYYQEESDDEGVSTETSSEEMIPESRYKNAVVAMNKAQRELAEKRKEDANRDSVIEQLQSQVQALTQQLASKSEQPETDVKPDQKTESSIDSGEDLEEALELYPEVINPLLSRIKLLEGKLNAMSGDVTASRQTMEDYRQQKRQEAYSNHWAQILDRHPDTREIVQSQEYASWYERQPNMIRQALEKGSAGDVIAALNLFKSEYPAQTEAQAPHNRAVNKQDKLAAAKAASMPNVKTSAKGKAPTKRTFTSAEINSMSMDEYRKYEKEIDEALAKGEIV